MNRYIVIGVIGIISGILCAQADVPLAWSGRRDDALDAKAVGRVSPWWTEVRESHFDLAFWFSCIGQPGTYLTMWMLAERISSASLATVLKISTFLTAYTGLLFHAAACTKPLVYRQIAGQIPEEAAQRAMDAVDKYPKIPSVISALCLLLVTPATVAAAILTGALAVPKYMVLFNPIGALPLLILARKWNIRIGGSMGIGLSLLAIVLLTAGCAA